MCVLLIEASNALRESLAADLREAGYPTSGVGDWEAALASATDGTHEVIVLDVDSPGRDWLELLRRIRAKGATTPVLLLTGEGSVADRVKGLNSGADDCVPKPFSLEELVARVGVLLRGLRRPRPSGIRVGELAIDPHARRVTHGGLAVRLTAREFQLLQYLAQRPGQLVTQYELEDHLYGTGTSPLSNSIASAICLLRKKLAAANGKRPPLHTKRGRGYYLGALESA